MSYTIRVIYPNGEMSVQSQDKKPDLNQLQTLVGGLIQAVPHWVRYDKLKADVWCNEEGLFNGSEFNHKATLMWLEVLGDGPFRYEPRLYGDIVIVTKDKV